MVERHIGTIKRMFNKLDDDPGKDPNLAMLEYRNTPIGEGLKSPNEIMFGRKIRGILPNKINYERERENRELKEKLISKQLRQKDYYDRSAHNLRPLNINDKVYVRKDLNKPLVPARITKICDRPRSYEVELSSGNKIERNRRHLYGPTYDDNRKNDELYEGQNTNVNDFNSERAQFEASDPPDRDTGASSPARKVNVSTEPAPSVDTRTRAGREVKRPDYLNDYVK